MFLLVLLYLRKSQKLKPLNKNVFEKNTHKIEKPQIFYAKIIRN